MSLKSLAVAAATVALVAVGAPASAATSTIDGSYAFNGNGWAGTLVVSNSASGAPAVTMHYNELGRDERLTGSWSGRTLTINRPLQWNNSQTYTLYLGDHTPNSPVFGGFFTQSDVPGQHYGVYAKDYLPLGTPRRQAFKADDTLPTDLVGGYGFNGNGWTGRMVVQFTACQVPEITLVYDEIGVREPMARRTWDPATHTLTFVRPLSFGGVTQTYTLYFANRLQSTTMFGGYFTESDVPGQRFAAFAWLQPGGVGC